MTMVDDRRRRAIAATDLAVVDFVHVDETTPTVLWVHFADPPPLAFSVDAQAVTVNAVRPEADPAQVGVSAVSWQPHLGRPALRVEVDQVGDFTDYELVVWHAEVDPAFDRARFDFRVTCERDVDCRPRVEKTDCLPRVDFDVDYRERDYEGLRRALLDFLAVRDPNWGDPVAADATVMLGEVFAALGDELTIYQDRIAAEARIEHAVQRRSVAHLARMVDYTWDPGNSASGFLCLEVAADTTIQTGSVARALEPDADPLRLTESVVRAFEVGTSLDDVLARRAIGLRAVWNEMAPHVWDADERPHLAAGATSIDVTGALGMTFGPVPADGSVVPADAWIVLEQDDDDPLLRHAVVVHVIEVSELDDPLVGARVTRLRWEPEQALDCSLDLRRTTVRANVVPIIAGVTQRRYFVVGPDIPDPAAPRTIERVGPQREGGGHSTIHRFGIEGSATRTLAATDGQFHVRLRSDRYDGTPFETFVAGSSWPDAWTLRASFFERNAATSQERAYTLDPGLYAPVGYRHEEGRRVPFFDYATSAGWTLRFGDGELGQTPPKWEAFELIVRLAGGELDNVAAGAVRELLPPDSSVTRPDAGLPQVLRVYNPTPLRDGRDEPPLARVRAQAPRAFREDALRAVRPEDYSAQASNVDGVQSANTRFRHTGTWVTAFTAPDALGHGILPGEVAADVAHRLEAVRQAGRPVKVAGPTYVDLDLRIHVCVAPRTSRAWAQQSLDDALVGSDRRPGYFHPDRWSFGRVLDPGHLEAAIYRVGGIIAVEQIEVRRRGWFDWTPLSDAPLQVGPRDVVRVMNDPLFPRRGSLQVVLEGGH